MITVFGYQIGMFSFFVFSILAGVVVAAQAIFGCKEETVQHRTVRAAIGVIYTAIAVAAFMQLESIESPYVEQFLPFLPLLAKRRRQQADRHRRQGG